MEHSDIFQQFVDEYTQHFKEGTTPTTADRDVQYSLELQDKRLKQKGYSIQYDYLPRGHFGHGGGIDLHWSDEIYDNCQQYRTYRRTKTVYKGNRKVSRKVQNELLYLIITDAVDPQPVQEEPYVCPNCGAVVKVKDLENGCPYCKSHFSMNELFPKVTNFFAGEDVGGTSEEVNREIRRFIIPCAVFLFVYAFFFLDLNSSTTLIQLIKSLLFGVTAGCVLGVFLWIGKELFKAFSSVGKSLGPLFNMIGARKTFMQFMKLYSPEFSYEYFTGKVNNLLKTILFSDAEDALPFYRGAPLNDSFGDILEANMFGHPGIRSFSIKDDHVYLSVKMYMDVMYANDKGVSFRRERFYIDLFKNVKTPMKYNFSVHKITCPSCGGSFDAGKHSNCPYCETRYPIEENEWIVTNLQKR